MLLGIHPRIEQNEAHTCMLPQMFLGEDAPRPPRGIYSMRQKKLPVSVPLNGQAVCVLLPFSLLSRTVCHPFFLRSNGSIFESV